MPELPKSYVPKEAETKWYPYWEKHGYFRARANPARRPYTIVIPPPNITGILTMGHVLNNTVQDVFIRWKRMQGYETLWMPGTDHAGIATQNVVEKSLAKEGKTRHDLGREKFVQRVWEWKELYGSTIIKQLRTLGVSCDWERTRFTMDEGLSAAVQEIFIRLYHKGLIYRGKYIVNWCPKDHTAISDDEVNNVEHEAKLYYLKYPIKGTAEFAIVATTRPETMLGDVAVAVHPTDERHKHLVGKTVILPLVGREMPIIADDFVDPKFGTGMVKITPAHDPNDYWVGQRHKLPQINIFDVSARISDVAPEKYRGLDRYDARNVIVKELGDHNLIHKVEPHRLSVGHCYRCDTVIEPYLSDQWFVKMKPLAEPALRAVLDGQVHFHPERWVRTYEHWMTNIRDWCISRQLWWGHRIPVWYCDNTEFCNLECKEPIVSKTMPARCPHCGTDRLVQDPDVLDTWFSSWLWPFSTLGWPTDNPDLRYFYPTSTLITGPDIIFFWVARMIMAGLEVMGEIPRADGSPRTSMDDIVPFKDVYFTSIIRDMKGRKMSKSLGNSPDPLDVIAEYGADALRFTIVYLAPLGQDVLYSNEKCEIGRNFANKIWNAGRFLLMNKDGLGFADHDISALDSEHEGHFDLADRWILSRVNTTIRDVNDELDHFEINQATKLLYDFAWHDYCDWYVEMIKGRLYGTEPIEVKRVVLHRAIAVFDTMLRLLHPFMPFVTEELWQNIAPRGIGESIMVSPYPAHDSRRIDEQTEREMSFVQNVINAIRNVRGELSVPPSKEIELVVHFAGEGQMEVIQKYQMYFQRLAKAMKIDRLNGGAKPKHAASIVVDGGEVYVPLEGLIDVEAERSRISKEASRMRELVASTEAKLANDGFVSRAPKDVVEREREKLQNFRSNLEKLQRNLEAL
jgi:valyl-tRNA synthetase